MKASDAIPGNQYWFLHYGLLRCGYHQGKLHRAESAQPMQSFFSDSEGRYYKLQDRERIAPTESEGLLLYIDYLQTEIDRSNVTIEALAFAAALNSIDQSTINQS